MTVYIGADHGGFALKEKLKPHLASWGYTVVDKGNTVLDSKDDFPVFAAAVAEEVSRDADHVRGILICRSGTGMDIAANKFRGVRSVLGMSVEQVRKSRTDDNVNVLSLPAEYLAFGAVQSMVEVFMNTPFEGAERQKRRVSQIAAFEK